MKEIFKSSNLKICQIVVGMISNNVYLIESDEQKAIVDPSANCEKILEMFDGTLDKILITHYHWDHIGAGEELKNITKATTYASVTDSKYIEDTSASPLNSRATKSFPIDVKLKENDTIQIGSTSWKVIETPGHTQGGICFYNEDNKKTPLLLSGDTLFCCSCGRTDFPDSDPNQMFVSLQKLAQLPDETLVFPGHEETTTILNERNYMLKNLN